MANEMPDSEGITKKIDIVPILLIKAFTLITQSPHWHKPSKSPSQANLVPNITARAT